MIFEVEIVDNKKSPLNYLENLETFSNGKVFKFKKGINIIVGKNGSGKSTLIKLISHYMLCKDSMVSSIPKETFKLASFFDSVFGNNDEPSLLDGVKVKSDYSGVAYHFLSEKDLSKNSDSALENIDQFECFLNSNNLSTGETVLYSLNRLFNLSFSNKDIQFPILQLKNLKDRVNDFWKENIDKILSYYASNRVNIEPKDFEYTFLLDEIDQNLDINNIETMYQIMSYQKEMTQLISVIHNPILIYKLSKLDYINFIEMSEGYLDSIKKVFSNL